MRATVLAGMLLLLAAALHAEVRYDGDKAYRWDKSPTWPDEHACVSIASAVQKSLTRNMGGLLHQWQMLRVG
jgi:hypothetical protein